MSKEDLIELLLPVGCVGIICIIVFSVLYSINNKINDFNLCKSYEDITGEKVIFTKGTCYKYSSKDRFEKVVFKGVE